MNPFTLLDPGRWLLYGAVVAAALFGLNWLDNSRQAIGERRVQAKWDADKARQTANALAESQANALETFRRLERQQKAQDARDEEMARAKADAIAAGRERDQLHDDLATYAAAVGGTSGNPATGDNGEAARAATGVLADLLRRADERAGILAKHADEARAAGLQCERSYQALTK